MRLSNLLSFLSLFFLSFGISAQALADWYVLLYSSETHTVYWLTESGISQTLLLEAGSTQAIASPNGKHMAYIFNDETNNSQIFYLVDLENAACCTILMDSNLTPNGKTYFTLGAFSPDSQKIALHYSFVPDDSSQSPYPSGNNGYIIFDLEAATFTTIMATNNMFVNSWADAGIILREPCEIGCGSDNPPAYSLLNPETGERVSYTPPLYPSESLETGERIELRPFVLTEREWAAGIMYGYEDERYPIYVEDFDSSPWLNLEIHWVANGRFVYLRDTRYGFDRFDGNALIIARDGRSFDVEMPSVYTSGWIASTADGWLTIDTQATSLIYKYSWDGQRFNQLLLAEALPIELRVLYRPAHLGQNLGELEPFPAVDAPPEYAPENR